ncbi:uncharacterized protein LOC142772072 isoform X5 [Rhipicephalus microplus]|uniref:uncharacterized protein LOC142772072 isoform X5 n=1 Tax=Rhipicephalus microplus TaxID=6941 RepID=UPI003F6B42E0
MVSAYHPSLSSESVDGVDAATAGPEQAMLEKEFCTTPSVQEYELAHYRRHRYVVSDDDGSSAEPKSSPQQLCLCERAGGARSSVLARSLQDNENQQQVGFVTENKVTPTSGQSHRPQRNASSKEQLDSTFRVLGPAGRISPPGMVIEPYFLGDSVTQISPTTFAFSRRRQQIAAPLSDADLATLARRSSSTTTFSDEDFQISYHKVLESSVASWLGDDDADDILGGTRSRYRQRRDADRVPSVELPSIRATHKTKSEQLTTRASGVEDVAVQRPRSEDLSVHMREPQPVALRHLETSIVQGALRSLHGQSRADSDAERLVIASRVGFGSSPAGENCSTRAPSPARPEDTVTTAVGQQGRRQRNRCRRVQADHHQRLSGDRCRSRLARATGPTRQGGAGAHPHTGQAIRGVQRARRSAGHRARGGGAVRYPREVTARRGPQWARTL